VFNETGNGPFVFGCPHPDSSFSTLARLPLLRRHPAFARRTLDRAAIRLVKTLARALDCPAVLTSSGNGEVRSTDPASLRGWLPLECDQIVPIILQVTDDACSGTQGQPFTLRTLDNANLPRVLISVPADQIRGSKDIRHLTRLLTQALQELADTQTHQNIR